MPLVRISLLKGRTAEYLQSVSGAIHQALVEQFEAPSNDLFQVIHQHEPGELIFDRHYQGGPRTENYVLVCITAGRPRSRAVKQAFYARLVELLRQSPGIDPEDVMVVINTTQPDEWSFAGARIVLPSGEQA